MHKKKKKEKQIDFEMDRSTTQQPPTTRTTSTMRQPTTLGADGLTDHKWVIKSCRREKKLKNVTTKNCLYTALYVTSSFGWSTSQLIHDN